MIVTVTPNPSIDRTVTLTGPLTRGAVHRVSSVTTEPGGKGVNVARALTLAGVDATAVLPAPATDSLVANAHALVDSIVKAKPAAAKGKFLRSVTLSSTMGPGVRIDTTHIDVAVKH